MPQPKLYIGHTGWLFLKKKIHLQGPGITSHKHVIGLTGQGKSKFLAHCYVELVSQGIACSLVDPHSDLADDVLGMLADRGLADDQLLFVDFGRRDRFVPFNVLRQPYPDDKVASIMVEACKRVWPALADGNAPMFENVMLAGCHTLIENKLPFAALPLFISDSRYRAKLLANVTDPLVVQYFKSTFDRLSIKDQLDQAGSSLRRVFDLVQPHELRYTIGQTENVLNFREIIDSNRSAIYDLGGLEEQTQKFLGALISHGYEVASLSRADQPERDRVPHHLFLDEFSMFSATTEGALGRILSLARKYKLTLWLAHQTWGQLSDRLANALQNTTRVAFALGFTDARLMAPNFTNYDPYLVKHIVQEGEERSHPIFFGVQDTFEKMATILQTLKPRHIFVRYPELERHWWFWTKPAIKTIQLKTPTVQTSGARVADLRERYAQMYLKPREEVTKAVDELLRTEMDSAEPPPTSSYRD